MSTGQSIMEAGEAMAGEYNAVIKSCAIGIAMPAISFGLSTQALATVVYLNQCNPGDIMKGAGAWIALAEKNLEAVEALLERRKGNAEAKVLALEPGCSDSEIGPPAGKHIECRRRFHQHAGIAVGDAEHHLAEIDSRRQRRRIGKRRIDLQHRLMNIAIVGNLKEMIHCEKG